MIKSLTRSWFLCLSLSLVLIACNALTFNNQQPEVVSLTVSVAASLQDAMKAIKVLYTKETPDVTIIYNFASSGSLQQQIEQGAPVDVFISAAPKQMNALESKGLLLEGTRQSLLNNQVVLVTPKDQTGISNFKDLRSDNISKIAMGDPESVPAGHYAKEVLSSLNLFEQLKPKLVFGKDVRQVLSYVETGNVDAGLVYATDAKVSNQVKRVATAPPESYSRIIYPVAVLKESKNPDHANQFVQFIISDSAKTIFLRYGFIMADKGVGSRE
ncbi:MAG: molybdate ABC transporter substrate-binding protein [Moorea sp. SIO4A1]|nr:molybdate ABC transporter substrate-binding protein [Moorena sp. SIO4A5]NEQ56143.1 molybdate ABC transporter substrate-binding protein [Moorena sp. SIO4A1]